MSTIRIQFKRMRSPTFGIMFRSVKNPYHNYREVIQITLLLKNTIPKQKYRTVYSGSDYESTSACKVCHSVTGNVPIIKNQNPKFQYWETNFFPNATQMRQLE